MNRDGSFKYSDITAANIREIAAKQSSSAEQRICELSELAQDAARYTLDMLDDGYGIYEILSMISDGFLNSVAVRHEDSLEENEARLERYSILSAAQDKINFTELFFDLLKNRGALLREKDFLPSDIGPEAFTYVKNPLADEAYDVFSQDFSDPRVRYSKTLAEAAHEVALGNFEYALLPLEEHGGARLASVAELIFKEDLKINSVIPVFGYEGLADMKYALVSKHFTVHDILSDDDRYLEIRLRTDSSIPLYELLMAADALGSSLYRVSTISFLTDDGSVPYYSVVFKDEGKDFSSLLTYLTLFSGAYTPIGLYKNLE